MPYNELLNRLSGQPNENEFNQFKRWLKVNSPTMGKGLTSANYRTHIRYAQWVAMRKPTVPVSAVTAPPVSTTSIAGVTQGMLSEAEYRNWYSYWLRSQIDDSGKRIYDEPTVTKALADMGALIRKEGFGTGLPGYLEAVEYTKQVTPPEGGTLKTNWQNSGYDVWLDQYGNPDQWIGKTDLPETEMTAWQQAQYNLGLGQLAQSQAELAQEKKYQQGQQNLSQLQYVAELAGMGEEGEIERWYAQQAQQAQFEADKEKREFTPEFKGISRAMGYPEKQYPNVLTAYTAKHAPEIWGNRGGFAEDYMSSGLVEKLGNIGINITGEETSPGTTRVMDVKLQPGWASQNMWGGKARPIGYTAGGGTELTLKPKTMGRFGQWTKPQGQVLPSVSEQYGEAKKEFTTKAKGKHKARPRPKAPPTPAWLPQFAPWTTAGQPMTRGQMPTPSGQLWGQTNPAVQAGLKGFLNWQGGGRSMADILGHMALMQPETPAGIWGRRWATPRQYT